MVEPDLIEEVPTTLPFNSLALARPFFATTTPGWIPIETSDRCTPPPPMAMKLITALQVLCMMLSEPAATACMPGETAIETVSISTPLAAKKPFFVATIPGHIVAVGETWPNETLVAALAASVPNAIKAMTSNTATLDPRRIRFSPMTAEAYVSGPCALKPD